MAMNTGRRLAAWMGALVLSILLAGCAGTAGLREAATLPRVERERMLGNWHIIANVPYFAERGNPWFNAAQVLGALVR